MNDCRQKTLNVGCMGEFILRYFPDTNGWNITFNTKEGNRQYMTLDCTEPTGEFTNTNDFLDTMFVPDWMWDQFIGDIDTLRIEDEHDSIQSPYTVGTA
jgi:hypothetical protein